MFIFSRVYFCCCSGAGISEMVSVIQNYVFSKLYYSFLVSYSQYPTQLSSRGGFIWIQLSNTHVFCGERNGTQQGALSFVVSQARSFHYRKIPSKKHGKASLLEFQERSPAHHIPTGKVKPCAPNTLCPKLKFSYLA